MTIRNLIMATALTVISTSALSAEDAAVLSKDFDFTFTPDGGTFAYYSYKDRALPDIYLRHHHDAEINLTKRSDTWDIEPDFSPDGSEIIYSSGISMAVMDLRIMNADGSHDRALFEGEKSEVGAEWSPDGRRILFTSFNMVSKTADIYVMDRDGSNLRNLTQGFGGTSNGGSWSPDGKTIAFVHAEKPDGDHDVYVMNADGSHRRKVSTTGGRKMGTLFTPGGEAIIYSQTAPDEWIDLYMVPVNGGEAEQVTDTPEATEYFPTFTPDGAHLVYSQGDWGNGFKFGHMQAPKLVGR